MTDRQIKKFFEMTPNDWENIKKKLTRPNSQKFLKKKMIMFCISMVFFITLKPSVN